MIALSRKIANNHAFQNFVLVVILVNAILVGLETSEDLVRNYGWLFDAMNFTIQAIFVFEIAVRILACGPNFLRFFRDGWNIFDFVIVIFAMLPAGGQFATVARLARLMRVVRLVSIFPELRLIVGTMLRSLSSMGNVILLLSLVMYVYAVLGYHLFSERDPENWGSLGLALLTLFEILTLEGWVELQNIGMEESSWVWLFYASYVMLAVFIVVNLFIAVVINNLETVKAETRAAEAAGDPQEQLLRRIEEMRANLDQLETELRKAQS